ncbi:MAG: signal peptide peptidase SppA [Desulfobacterales bacterium]|nr:signal peptide peptidase SppA [Desulfobacterales bacterium]MDX2512725.1 signal peptide peptidase SppA [Desulfobacterales bacterium]
MNRIGFSVLLLAGIIFIGGCAAPQIKLFSDASDPLKESILQGTEKGKVLVVSLRGVISTRPKEGTFRTMPSMVQEVVSQLRMAEKDKEIKCLLLKVDSPGGTATASDILYNEILAFKKRTKAKIVVSMMDIAASGGYYVSLPADIIFAHPTTITGSIGVIFMRPNVTGFVDKIGFTMDVNKSGKNKDMGSPFRRPTAEETQILQDLTDGLADQFLKLVAKHRGLEETTLSMVTTARVYLPTEAKALKLIDRIGYLDEAIAEAIKISGLPEKAKVVAYRRSMFPNDNLYNPLTTSSNIQAKPLLDLGIQNAATHLSPGFYYVWAPALGL